MAAPSGQRDAEELGGVRLALNELRALNVLHTADTYAMRGVIKDYFTSRDGFDSDSDDSDDETDEPIPSSSTSCRPSHGDHGHSSTTSSTSNVGHRDDDNEPEMPDLGVNNIGPEIEPQLENNAGLRLYFVLFYLFIYFLLMLLLGLWHLCYFNFMAISCSLHAPHMRSGYTHTRNKLWNTSMFILSGACNTALPILFCLSSKIVTEKE